MWLLEELNLEYDIKIFKRGKDFRSQDDLKAIHALGKSPVIGITPAGSEKEIIIAESETIVEYVCEHFGRHLIPQRYPEGKEGVIGAETEEFMRYKVRLPSTPLLVCGFMKQFRLHYSASALWSSIVESNHWPPIPIIHPATQLDLFTRSLDWSPTFPYPT